MSRDDSRSPPPPPRDNAGHDEGWGDPIPDYDLPDGDTRRLIEPGSMVDHFQVVRLVGQGGMGEVYLARDTKLGRKVALKVIHPSQMGSRSASERFLFEARTTARFNHPHIVTVFDVGETRGRPYVALEFLEGQTLRERYEHELPTARETMRVGLAIADALAEAHRHGILHRDLKPENVIIPRDGRLRVVDFGLARVVHTADSDPRVLASCLPPHVLESIAPNETDGRQVCGTPAYMAPEQWENRPVGEPADIWALGLILYELVCGRRPYQEVEGSFVTLILRVSEPDPVPSDPSMREINAALAELILQCLDKAASRRPTAAQLRDTLRTLLHTGHQRLSDEESPFRGLQPFTERHAAFFFGRTSEVEVFLERLRDEPVLPVVGPSGAGKSSFVHAGVIPRLREQASWTVLALRPGPDPFGTLASRLLAGDSSMGRRSTLGAVLRGGGTRTQRPAISRVMTAKITVPGGRVGPTSSDGDSLEEAVAWADSAPPEPPPDAEAMARNIDRSPTLVGLLLQQLAVRENSKVLLVVDQLEELYTLVDDDAVRRRFMQALCTAADDPLAPVRVVFTLRDDFLGRLAEGPEARDALSHVIVIRSPGTDPLREILTLPARAVGYEFDDPALVPEMIEAVRGEPSCLPLLQFTLRTLWDRRDKVRRMLCRATYDAMGGVAGALAEHADGVLQGMSPAQVHASRELLLRLVTPDGTRRVMPVARALEGIGAEGPDVLTRLTRARLINIRKGHDGAPGETPGDEGLPAEATLELVHESLIHSWGRLAQWMDESREELAFLSEALQAAELWIRRGRHAEEVWHGDALSDARRILGRGGTTAPGLVQEFLAAGDALDRRAARLRRWRTLAVWIVLLVIAAGTTAAALVMARKENVATARWAEAQREGARAAMLRGDLLEARAKLRGSLETQDSPAARALWWTLEQHPLVWAKELGAYLYDGALSPDGRTVAVGSADRSVYLIDVDTRQVRQILRGHPEQVFSVAFSPDGTLLAAATRAGQVWLWDPTTGELVKTLPEHPDRARDLAFSTDGRWLAAGSWDSGTIPMWDVETGALARTLTGHEAMVRGLAFSPDRLLLASTSDDGTVRLWDPDTGALKRVLLRDQLGVICASFNHDGCILATGSDDGVVRLWDPGSGRLLRELVGHSDTVFGLSFSPDGTRLASAGNDRTIRVWDLGDGEVTVLEGHTAGINALSFSLDGKRLLSVSADQSVRVWEMGVKPQAERITGHTAWIMDGTFDPTGTLIATSAADQTIRLWDPATGDVVRVLHGHTGEVSTVTFSLDGTTLYSGSWDKSLRSWDIPSGRPLRTLASFPGWIRAIALHPRGTALAAACQDGNVRIVDTATGVLRTLQGPASRVLAVAYSSDGRRVASGSEDASIRIWDPLTSREIAVLHGPSSSVRGIAFAPAGDELATGAMDGTVRLWDLASGRSRVVGRHDGAVYDLSFDPAGTRIGAPSADGRARLWDLQDGSVGQLVGHRGEVNFLSFSPDGSTAVTGSDDGTVRLWSAADGTPVWRAPLMLAEPPVLYSHRGWTPLDPGAATEVTGQTAWRTAVEQRARQADVDDEASHLCLRTHDDELEIWDLHADQLLHSEGITNLSHVLATATGCVSLADGQVRHHGLGGEQRQYAPNAQCVARDDAGILVASGRQVFAFDEGGQQIEILEADVGVTAMLRLGHWIALGYREGDVQLVRSAPSLTAQPDPPPFEDVPSSPVVSLLAGPMNTLVVGYANGMVGIWDLSNGVRLDQHRLHGPVVHLLLRDERLYAATELGDHLVIDLGAFYADYCELVRQVWEGVPVVWSGGLPVPTAPPSDHPCSAP